MRQAKSTDMYNHISGDGHYKRLYFLTHTHTHTHLTLTGCIVSCGNLIWVWRLGILDTEVGTHELLVVYQCLCHHRNTVNIEAGWSVLFSLQIEDTNGHFQGKGVSV